MTCPSGELCGYEPYTGCAAQPICTPMVTCHEEAAACRCGDNMIIYWSCDSQLFDAPNFLLTDGACPAPP